MIWSGARAQVFKTEVNEILRNAPSLLQDAANATLQSETLRETVCDAIIANGGVKTHQKSTKRLR